MNINVAIKEGINIAVNTILDNIKPDMTYEQIVGIIKCLIDEDE